MACHTRSGVAGISIWWTPSSARASTIVLITAANAGVVPPSPPERTPSLFVGVGTSLSAVSKNGSVSARGIPIIHEARCQELPALRLVIAVLEKRLADALGNSAMRLTVQDQRVDRAPDIAPQPLGKPARSLLRLGTGNVEVG
jgi:hypothetical protein